MCSSYIQLAILSSFDSQLIVSYGIHVLMTILILAGSIVHNLYTVRVYRSPSHTTGDKIAIIGVSLYGRLYDKVRVV